MNGFDSELTMIAIQPFHPSPVVRGFTRAFLFFALAIALLPGKAVWAQPHSRLSKSLQEHVASKSKTTVDVIVQGTADQIDALAAKHKLTMLKRLDDGAVFRASSAQVDALGNDGSIDHVARDVKVTSFMAVTDPAIGADQVWAGVAGLPGFTGKGIGIVIIDSGVWAQHNALSGRVVFQKDFTNDGNGPADKYGHGTHVAGIIAGNSPYPQDSLHQTPFRGVAPGANLISLRAIGADGTGNSSDVIDAINWAIRNRNRFNIRVINLSLGHAVEESYKDDPLCQTVERAVNAGIVVVAAAGNHGKDAAGQSIYGGIESPGNDPYALTVGALNTHGTVARSDDELTTYSAKGPTVIDALVKPDIAAPGNKIVSAEAPGSTILAETPDVHTVGSGADAYATLSGTSMATGVVSGAAALVLDANGKLTPAQVKAALQYSASFMAGVGMLGAGAGSLNIAAGVQVAEEGPVVSGIETAIGGQTVSISSLLTLGLKTSRTTGEVVWQDTIVWGNRRVRGDTIVWGNKSVWGSTIVWGNALNDPVNIWGSWNDDTIVWGNAWDDDTIVWGNWEDDTIVWGNRSAFGE